MGILSAHSLTNPAVHTKVVKYGQIRSASRFVQTAEKG